MKAGKKSGRKLLALVLSLLMIVTLFPERVRADKTEKKVWKISEVGKEKGLQAGEILTSDMTVENDTAYAGLQIVRSLKEEKEPKETEVLAVLDVEKAVAVSSLKEKAVKDPKAYGIRDAESWNGSWKVVKAKAPAADEAAVLEIMPYEFIPVTDVTGIPETIRGTTELKGKIVPEDATVTAMEWSVTDAGTTGAAVKDRVLTVTAPGTAKLKVTVKNGGKDGKDFVKEVVLQVAQADYTKVDSAIGEAEQVAKELYTEESLKRLSDAVQAVVRGKLAEEQEAVDGYAAAILEAMDALVYRPADYTRVDAAMESVPENLDAYKEESVKALQDAMAAVERGKNITEQETVDGYAAALEAAVANLEEIPVEPPVEYADYAAVDAAIAKIPENLDFYTRDSVEALEAAVAAVVRDLTAAEQETVDGYAAAIEAAIAGLKYREADYTAVDAAIEKVPAELKLYTEDSVAALQKALDAVVRGHMITEQETVDGYAAAIERAIAGLTVREADYTKVDAALKRIPADLSLYTDESIKTLLNAKAAVVRGEKITEQEKVDGYAAAIEAAIQALVYREADYSKVDTALKKIPSNLSAYTDESVKKLEDARKAVVRGKKITEQKTVDGYAEAIELAVKNLKKKPIKAEELLPKITKGSGQTVTQGKEISFTSDGLYKNLKKVLVDKKELDKKYYTAEDKSGTKLTLKGDYVKTLAPGKHTLSMVFSNGQADVVFTVKKASTSPQTGDTTDLVLWFILLAVSGCAVGGMAVKRRKMR